MGVMNVTKVEYLLYNSIHLLRLVNSFKGEP